MDKLSQTVYEIDIDALKNNCRIIKNHIGEKTKLCAMVKANAYGSELKIVAKALKNEVDIFAVATLSEGIELRKQKINSEIIVMQAPIFRYINKYIKYKLTPVLSDFSGVNKLSRKVQQPLLVQFCVNTGMHRFGFNSKSEFLLAKSEILKNKNINISGIFSHLATKEEDIDFINLQNEKFKEYKNLFNNKDVLYHLSNSNAMLNHKELNYDMVRCGFSIYGFSDNVIGLSPCVRIYSEISFIHYADKGESVGYGRTRVLERNTKIGVVPIGYADGYDRRMSNNGYVLVNGKRANILGNICMDCFMVDITDIDNVEIGTKITLLGKNGKEELTLKDYSKFLNTSEYDCLLAFRTRRMNVITKTKIIQ